MPFNRHTKIVLLVLVLGAALLLACQCSALSRPSSTPAAATPGLEIAAATPTPTVTQTASPAATTPPTATQTAGPTSTQTQVPTPTALPPLPDRGPLPAIWTEIDLRPSVSLNPVYLTDVVVDEAARRAYVLSSCERASLHAEEAPPPCVSSLDLETNTVLHTAVTPGSSTHGDLVLSRDALYLHHPWSAELYALDRSTLAVRDTITGVHGIAYDGSETTYVVTTQGLARLEENGTLSRSVERTYDNPPVAMAADEDRVYVLGYNVLQVFDADLTPVSEIVLEDGQLRTVALDARRDRLYVGNYDGLYVYDAAADRFSKAPESVQNARGIVLDPTGKRLYLFSFLPGWFGGTAVIVVDTETWNTQTLYTALSGELRAMALDEDRLLVASNSDHALIPLDPESGVPAPRLPVGIRVVETIVDPASNRLYASDSAGWIHAFDRETYEELDRAYGGQQISLDPSHRRLYAGDARLPVVTVFDSASLEIKRTIPQPGRPRANAATGEVVIVNRRFYVFDGASGKPQTDLEPWVGVPSKECAGCFYTIGTDIAIDAGRGLTMPTTYTPWPGKPGPMASIDYDPDTGRTYHALQTGGYVLFSSIAIYPDMDQLRTQGQPTLRLEGLSGHIRLDAPARRLYVSRGTLLFVLDSETLQRIGRIDVGHWSPIVTAVDSDLGRLYTPRGDRLVVWTATGGAPAAPLPHEPVVITRSVTSILPSPNFAADRTLLASIDSKLCRSTDGGETWRRLRGGLPDLGYWSQATSAIFTPNYARDRTMFYSGFLSESHGEGIYRSTDGGETWQSSSEGLYDLRVYRIVPSPRYAMDGTLLAYARTRPGEALYRSTDRGETWNLVSRQVEYGTPPLPRPEDLFTLDSPLPQFRCDYDGSCTRSADGGKTWDPLDTAQYRMASLVDFALSPTYEQDRTVYLLTQGALFRYNDRTQRGEICTTPPLYGERDYSTGFTSVATAATGGDHVLFVGSNAGEFLRLAPGKLSWDVVWPLEDTPTPVPQPSPTPCAYEVDAWLEIDYAKSPSRLGCPAAPAAEIAVAYQPFELGMMFWHQDRAIYVLQQDGTWAEYEDTWTPDQLDRDPTLVPPEGRHQPVRGFGSVWREWLDGPDAWIGWATAEERGGTTIAQPFANGLLLVGLDDVTYALYTDGTWTSMSHP
jgi:photosystem II stability/assembly factor-like uncharacterized protein